MEYRYTYRWGFVWRILKEDFAKSRSGESGELEQNVWKVAFAAPVYIMNDNTFHWVCLWLTLKFLHN